MDIKLSTKLSQNLVMTPQLQQAIKLLTLNHMELNDAIQKEMVENPVLEEFEQLEGFAGDREYDGGREISLDSPQTGSGEASNDAIMGAVTKDVELTRNDNAQSKEIDWESYLDSFAYRPPTMSSSVGSLSNDLPGYDQTLTRAESLEEHLIWQLHMSESNAQEVEVGERLIGQLGDDAFLDLNDYQNGFTEFIEELHRKYEWSYDIVNAVRQRIQAFDPIGCASIDLQDCLLFQLQGLAIPESETLRKILEEHFEALHHKKYKEVAKALGLKISELGELLKKLELLEPRPARNFLPQGISETQHQITPDVYVIEVNGELEIRVNDDGLPSLKISPFYMKQMQDKNVSKDSRAYLKDRVKSASWLIRSVHQRQRTVYLVTEALLKVQKDWFENEGELVPLTLRQVADEIEMHESTISRVTTRKYLHCPRGIFELKYFFNSSIQTQDGSEIASEAVKDALRSLIANENPKKPYSDSKLVTLLAEKNFKVARRTVAKYREGMGFESSSKRKNVF